MKIIHTFLLMTNILFAGALNLNGLYLYDAKEVLAYKNPNDNRKILLIFSSSSCSHCLTFKNQLASLDTRTKQYLSSRYIFAISENDNSLGQMFGVTSTPTSFILNQKKQLLVQPMIGEPQIIDEFVTYLIAVSKS